MSTTNLYDENAKKKIKGIAEDVDFCMMATNLTVQPLSVIPMSTKEVDSDGAIWFLSNKDSDHNADIISDPTTQLLYSGTSEMKFLSVYGTSEIIHDRDTIAKLYSSADNAWFDGKDDPNITAIKFKPSEAAYWSNDGNKLVTLFKLAKAAVTGENQDIGTSGKLSV